MSISCFQDKNFVTPNSCHLSPPTSRCNVHVSLLRIREGVVLHFLACSATSEEDIRALSRIFTGFEDRRTLATLRTERDIVRQHQNCSSASVQTQTFCIGFQILSRLANSASRHDGRTQDLTAAGSQVRSQEERQTEMDHRTP